MRVFGSAIRSRDGQPGRAPTAWSARRAQALLRRRQSRRGRLPGHDGQHLRYPASGRHRYPPSGRWLSACATNGGPPPDDLAPWLPWRMDEGRARGVPRSRARLHYRRWKDQGDDVQAHHGGHAPGRDHLPRHPGGSGRSNSVPSSAGGGQFAAPHAVPSADSRPGLAHPVAGPPTAAGGPAAALQGGARC